LAIERYSWGDISDISEEGGMREREGEDGKRGTFSQKVEKNGIAGHSRGASSNS